MRAQRITLLLLCFVLSALVSCGGIPVPGVQYGAYLAKIDRVEPEIPGLIVKETTAVVGAITVINETRRDIYIYNEEGYEEILKITPSEVLRKDKDGQWVHLRSSNVMSLNWGVGISYDDHSPERPRGQYNGQVMKEWVVHGRVDDTPFKIIGRTVYYLHLPPTPTRTPEPAKE